MELPAWEFHQNSFLLAPSRGRFRDALEWYDAAPDKVRGGIVTGADVAFTLNRAGEADRRPAVPALTAGRIVDVRWRG